MAETAKILAPEKTVLLPDEKAGCSLAEGISVDDVRRLRELYPGAPVVTYVNTYAAVKAESDYCCTSGNSTAVLRHLFNEGHDRVIFLPDEYLARNTAADLEGIEHEVIADRGFDPQLWQEIDGILRAAVELGVAFLATEAFDFRDGEALHAKSG